MVDPVRVDGGWLTARDHRADDVRQFAVHRIRTVHPVDDAADGRPTNPLASLRRLESWISSGTPSRRLRCSTRSCPTSTRWSRFLDNRAWLQPQVNDRDVAVLRRFQRDLRPVFEASAHDDPQGRGRRAQRAAREAPDHAADRRPQPGPLHIHVANRAASVADLLSASRCSAWPTWSATSARPGSGSARPRRAPTSTSTPRPTSRVATAPTAAPRAPTSRPTAPARRPPRAEPDSSHPGTRRRRSCAAGT